MKKRVTVRPSKTEGIFGVVFGLVFVCIGLFVATPMLGIFGILWTLLAVGITFYNAYLAFGKKYAGPEITIEDVEAPVEEDAQSRLEQLEDLQRSGLITPEEYQAKREEVLQDL